MTLLLSQLSSDDSGSSSPVLESGKTKDHVLPMLSFSCIVASTNNFSATNKLGEGGYGPVYKVFVTLIPCTAELLSHIHVNVLLFLPLGSTVYILSHICDKVMYATQI